VSQAVPDAAKSAWKLGQGVSVGSQTLTGLPYLNRLRSDAALGLRVWPQDTDFVADPFTATGTNVILAEIFPSIFDEKPSLEEVKDARQVDATVKEIMARDRAGTLSQWFNPGIISKPTREQARNEGWILGVT
jgi:hypothetical protein